ncbi:Cutinase [Mycena sanguinolenta]|uniref:Cutinase n=1 Tax=Mycena sanguinolenta TaxID=230812 RepID=A0A8H6XVC8_9AGAR|nr:Cutinase [Mycena sanguinolenta]
MLRSLIALVALSLAVAVPVTKQAADACMDVIVIFACGTLEPAPIGIIVGPHLERSIILQTLRDSWNTMEILRGPPLWLMMQLANAANSCPDAAIVTSGYSQGGQLVHNSAKLLSASVLSRIKAAVIFGDPDDGEPVQGVPAANTDVICHFGDDICAHGILILPPHLTYGADTPAAAAFIAARV